MNKYSIIYFTALCLLSVSCTKEQIPTNQSDRKSIVPVISSIGPMTKSGTQEEAGRVVATYALGSLDGGDSLYVSLYEYDNNSLPPELSEHAPLTKGQVLTTATINRNGRMFSMDGWLESQNRYDGTQDGDGRVYVVADATNCHFMKRAIAEYRDSCWSLSSLDDVEGWNTWRNQVPTNFWSIYPAVFPPALGAGETGSMQVTYPADAPTANLDEDDAGQKIISIDYAMATDAVDQEDICVAYNRKTWSEGENNEVDIKFQHALSAIYFDVSGVNQSEFESVDISINNVHRRGTCTVTGSGTNSVSFDWQPTGDASASVEHRFLDISANSADFDANRVQKFDGPGCSSNIFMVVPQTLSNDSQLKVVFTKNDGTTYESYLSRSIAWHPTSGEYIEWKPGKKYLYKIGRSMEDSGESDWEFKFAANANNSNDSKNTVRLFNNTLNDSTITDIRVISKKNGVDTPFEIESIKIGSAPSTIYNTASFSGLGGLNAVVPATGDSRLELTSLKRQNICPGTHDYWVNKDGISGPADPYDHDWSPEDWSSKGVIDLSTYNFESEKIHTNIETANCYIIRHAGTYKIPLVYGNAYCENLFNIESIKPTLDPTSAKGYVLKHFVNHLGDEIGSPFIENNLGCVAVDVEVLWQDKANILKNVQIKGNQKTRYSNIEDVRWIEFTIDQNDICQNNALVAVKDRNGNIIWSWHIWVTNDPRLLDSSIRVTNNSGVTYGFFPLYCLGWIDAENYAVREDVVITLRQKVSNDRISLVVKQPAVIGTSTGTFYQHGRKDPMCSTDAPVQGNFYSGQKAQVSISQAIKHPNAFYCYDDTVEDVSYGSWLKDRFDNLWSGCYCDTSYVLGSCTKMVKTVYDPSPRNYRVPEAEAFTGFTTSGSVSNNYDEFNVCGSWRNGWYFYTSPSKTTVIFFPSTGIRSGESGRIVSPNISQYWTPFINHASSAYNFGYSFSTVDPFHENYRARGFSIRPVFDNTVYAF